MPFSPQSQKLNVNDTSRYEVVVNGLKRKLIIKKCNPLTDRGHYVCRCGVSTTTCLLGVKPSLKFIKPLEENIEALEETDYEFVVEVSKPNLRSHWVCKGRTINPNEEKYAGRFSITSDGCFHRFAIKNLDMKDANEYTVHVDELSCKTNFTVKESEKVPRVDMSKIPKVLKVKAGKALDLEIPYNCKLNK